MFSHLDPIFRGTLRHAETMDTRQGIRRHDPDDEKRRRKHAGKDEEKTSSLWEDSTAVSVKALKAFLENILESATQEKDPVVAEEKPGISEQTKPREKRHDGDTISSRAAAKAASAYQTTARAMHRDTAEDNIPAAPINPDATRVALSAQEIRIMHQLIVDLDVLATRHIEQLPLQRSENFLQSLVDAVAELK